MGAAAPGFTSLEAEIVERRRGSRCSARAGRPLRPVGPTPSAPRNSRNDTTPSGLATSPCPHCTETARDQTAAADERAIVGSVASRVLLRARTDSQRSVSLLSREPRCDSRRSVIELYARAVADRPKLKTLCLLRGEASGGVPGSGHECPALGVDLGAQDCARDSPPLAHVALRALRARLARNPPTRTR